MDNNCPQQQAVYAKVHRRVAAAAVTAQQFNESASATSTSNSSIGSKDTTKFRTFHVTLFKDTVYDDYGFSVSDGLYERGVFINRIRSGGPADVVGLLKPFDRIMQVVNVAILACIIYKFNLFFFYSVNRSMELRPTTLIAV